MLPTLIDKQTLQLINRKSLRYSLAAAEKDYFLALALKILNESPLFTTLVFKGGTALHHCYLPQSRFSEDLDFTTLDKALIGDSIASIFAPHTFLKVKKLYVSNATIKIQELRYFGVLDYPNWLKFEVDRLQDVVLPAQQRIYENVWGLDVIVNVMDIREIYAEKLRAMSQRARYRDFYDFYLITQQYKFDLNETIRLVQQKEIRVPISKSSILENWQIASKKRSDEIDLVYYKRDVFDSTEPLEGLLTDLPFKTITPDLIV